MPEGADLAEWRIVALHEFAANEPFTAPCLVQWRLPPRTGSMSLLLPDDVLRPDPDVLFASVPLMTYAFGVAIDSETTP